MSGEHYSVIAAVVCIQIKRYFNDYSVMQGQLEHRPIGKVMQFVADIGGVLLSWLYFENLTSCCLLILKLFLQLV